MVSRAPGPVFSIQNANGFAPALTAKQRGVRSRLLFFCLRLCRKGHCVPESSDKTRIIFHFPDPIPQNR